MKTLSQGLKSNFWKRIKVELKRGGKVKANRIQKSKERAELAKVTGVNRLTTYGVLVTFLFSHFQFVSVARANEQICIHPKTGVEMACDSLEWSLLQFELASEPVSGQTAQKLAEDALTGSEDSDVQDKGDKEEVASTDSPEESDTDNADAVQKTETADEAAVAAQLKQENAEFLDSLGGLFGGVEALIEQVTGEDDSTSMTEEEVRRKKAEEDRKDKKPHFVPVHFVKKSAFEAGEYKSQTRLDFVFYDEKENRPTLIDPNRDEEVHETFLAIYRVEPRAGGKEESVLIAAVNERDYFATKANIANHHLKSVLMRMATGEDDISEPTRADQGFFGQYNYPSAPGAFVGTSMVGAWALVFLGKAPEGVDEAADELARATADSEREAIRRRLDPSNDAFSMDKTYEQWKKLDPDTRGSYEEYRAIRQRAAALAAQTGTRPGPGAVNAGKKLGSERWKKLTQSLSDSRLGQLIGRARTIDRRYPRGVIGGLVRIAIALGTGYLGYVTVRDITNALIDTPEEEEQSEAVTVLNQAFHATSKHRDAMAKSLRSEGWVTEKTVLGVCEKTPSAQADDLVAIADRVKETEDEEGRELKPAEVYRILERYYDENDPHCLRIIEDGVNVMVKSDVVFEGLEETIRKVFTSEDQGGYYIPHTDDK